MCETSHWLCPVVFLPLISNGCPCSALLTTITLARSLFPPIWMYHHQWKLVSSDIDVVKVNWGKKTFSWQTVASVVRLYFYYSASSASSDVSNTEAVSDIMQSYIQRQWYAVWTNMFSSFVKHWLNSHAHGLVITMILHFPLKASLFMIHLLFNFTITNYNPLDIGPTLYNCIRVTVIFKNITQ